MPYWKKVYAIAPTLNGRINKVYSNGRDLFYLKFQKESNPIVKKEYAELIIKLFEEEEECFPNLRIEALPKDVIDYLESN